MIKTALHPMSRVTLDIGEQTKNPANAGFIDGKGNPCHWWGAELLRGGQNREVIVARVTVGRGAGWANSDFVSTRTYQIIYNVGGNDPIVYCTSLLFLSQVYT